MFLKIIYKSEASYLFCYEKRSYTESIGRSFSTQYLCPKLFSVRDYSGRFQDLAKQIKVRFFGQHRCGIGKKLSNQQNGYQKAATLKVVFL